MVFGSAEERLRRDAARWFGRMRGPNAFRYNSKFKAWLDADPSHRIAYDRLSATWGLSSLLSQSRAAEARLQVAATQTGVPSWLPVALAALLLAILALAFAVMLAWRPISRTDVLATALGQRRTLVLSDGSRLVLDADSAVAPEMSARQRGVRLVRGRARFVVAAGSAPFVVTADSAVVSAHATTFDVDRIAANRVDIALLQGTIDIGRSRGFHLLPPARLVRLSGGQDASLRGGRLSLVARPQSPIAPDWTMAPLAFERTPISDALVEVNRYSPRRIRLGSPDLAGLRITGVFDAVPTTELAQALARALGLSLSTAPNGDLVLNRRAV
jgi:transmembrane sensor